MSRQRVNIDLRATSERPKLWLTDGSKWKRASGPLPYQQPTEKLELANNFQDALPEGSTRSVLFKQVRILTPGEWNGWVDLWTEDFIRQVAENFNPSRPRPLQVDHSKRADDNHGKVVDLIAFPPMAGEPASLIGLVAIMGAHAIERVEDGRWDQFSGSFYIDDYPELDELSFTPFPACTETAFLIQQEEKEGHNVPNLAKDEATVAVEAPVAPQEIQPAPKVEAVSTPSVELASLTAQLAEQRAEIELLRKQQEETAKLRLTEQVSAKVLELTRAGKSVPAQFDAEVQFAIGLTEEQRQAYFALRESQPKLLELTRASSATLSFKKPGDSTDAELEAEIERMKELL